MTPRISTHGEDLGDGIVLSPDLDAGLIRVKLWGDWHDVTPSRARKLATHLDTLGVKPRAYDVHGAELGCCIHHLRLYALAVETAAADQS